MIDREQPEALLEREIITPDEYQRAVFEQVDENWLATRHNPLVELTGRLYGETRELVLDEDDMFEAVAFGRGNAFKDSQTHNKIKSELGDILWYATVLHAKVTGSGAAMQEILDEATVRIAGRELPGGFDAFQAPVYDNRHNINFWRNSQHATSWPGNEDEAFADIFSEPLAQIVWLAELVSRKVSGEWEHVKEDVIHPEELEILRLYAEELKRIPETGEVPEIPRMLRRDDRLVDYVNFLKSIPVEDVIGNVIAMVAVISRSVIGTDLSEVASYNLWKNEERKKRGTQFDKTKRVIDPETGEKL